MWQNSTWSWTTGCCSSFVFSQHFLWVLACSEAISPPLSLLFPLLTMRWGPVFLLFAWGFVAGFSFWCINNMQQSELEVSDDNGVQSIIIIFFPLNVFGIQDSIILLLTLIDQWCYHHNLPQQVCHAILDSGKSLSKHERSISPLMYTWHDKHYVGAAHGIVGIMFMLLQVSSEGFIAWVMQVCSYNLQYLQLESSNFSSKELLDWYSAYKTCFKSDG